MARGNCDCGHLVGSGFDRVESKRRREGKSTETQRMIDTSQWLSKCLECRVSLIPDETSQLRMASTSLRTYGRRA